MRICYCPRNGKGTVNFCFTFSNDKTVLKSDSLILALYITAVFGRRVGKNCDHHGAEGTIRRGNMNTKQVVQLTQSKKFKKSPIYIALAAVALTSGHVYAAAVNGQAADAEVESTGRYGQPYSTR